MSIHALLIVAYGAVLALWVVNFTQARVIARLQQMLRAELSEAERARALVLEQHDHFKQLAWAFADLLELSDDDAAALVRKRMAEVETRDALARGSLR